MNQHQRWILYVIWVASVLLISGCRVPGLPAPAREPIDLTILHTGQVYGEILPCG